MKHTATRDCDVTSRQFSSPGIALTVGLPDTPLPVSEAAACLLHPPWSGSVNSPDASYLGVLSALLLLCFIFLNFFQFYLFILRETEREREREREAGRGKDRERERIWAQCGA